MCFASLTGDIHKITTSLNISQHFITIFHKNIAKAHSVAIPGIPNIASKSPDVMFTGHIDTHKAPRNIHCKKNKECECQTETNRRINVP